MPTDHETLQERAYIRRSGHRRLEQALADCCQLYNASLEHWRDTHRRAWKALQAGPNQVGQVFEEGKRRRADAEGEGLLFYRSGDILPSSDHDATLYAQMQELTAIRADLPDWQKYDVQIGRGMLVRLGRAKQDFFRRISEGQKAGYPRFKSRSRFRCIEIPGPRPSMVKQERIGKALVRIKGLPTLRLKPDRQLPPSKHLKTIHVVQRPNGYYVDLIYEAEKEPLKPTGQRTGADMGVNKRLTLSCGDYAEPLEQDTDREEKLRQAVSRKRKGSNSRRKAVAALSKETHRKRVKRRNANHRMTSEIIRRFGQIAIEDLQIANMTGSASGTMDHPGTNVAQKTGLNRSILSQGWGETARQLEYKAEWAGRQLVKVNPRGTSQECSQCGAKPPQHEYAVFRCNGHDPPLELDRDTNAARNIEYRGFGERYNPAAETPAGRGREFAPGP